MGIRAVRRLTIAYMIAFLLAVTWPGFLIFNHVQPIIFGLPFNLFCIALLVVGGMAVLLLLYRAENNNDMRRSEEER